MADSEKFLWYFEEYALLLGVSLFYFVTLSSIGYFLILKRSVFFGLVLTKLAQCSFVLGFSLFALNHGHAFELINQSAVDEWEGTLLRLDLYVLPLFWGSLSLLVLFTERLRAHWQGLESLFAIIFVILSGMTHLSYKLFGSTDLIVSKSYFTEILYTPLSVFIYYLYFLLPLFTLFLLFFQRFLAVSFDPTQAVFSGLSVRFYDFLFYFLAGTLVAICLRVLGFYLSLAALFIPAFLALSLFRGPRSSFLFSAVFSLSFALIGFCIAFIYDELPTEPVLILSFGFQAALIGLLWRFVRK